MVKRIGAQVGLVLGALGCFVLAWVMHIDIYNTGGTAEWLVIVTMGSVGGGCLYELCIPPGSPQRGISLYEKPV